MDEHIVWETKKNIEFIVNEVANRGWTDDVLNIDYFADLRKDRNICESQISALYEEYFLPKRHEFEWKLLSDIVYALINAPTVQFTSVAIAGGVIGNAAYDLLKNLCTHTASFLRQKLAKKYAERSEGFINIANDADRLKLFFQKKKKARIAEIEEGTGITRERIYPLMKLAGFNHYRRGEPCMWEIPE